MAKSSPHFSPPRPTLLISPYAFAIIDALLRVPHGELNCHQYAFAKKYKLSQPRLSAISAHFGIRKLKSLRSALLSLPVQWWITAMRYPRTQQRMKPFLNNATSFMMRDRERKDVSSLVDAHLPNLLPGPVEVAKTLGLVYDSSTYVWVSEQELSNFKKRHQLIPVSRIAENAIIFSTTKRGFEKESITSCASIYGLRSMPACFDHLNMMRVIWDLGFGDSRLGEAQEQLMRNFLREEL